MRFITFLENEFEDKDQNEPRMQFYYNKLVVLHHDAEILKNRLFEFCKKHGISIKVTQEYRARQGYECVPFFYLYTESGYIINLALDEKFEKPLIHVMDQLRKIHKSQVDALNVLKHKFRVEPKYDTKGLFFEELDDDTEDRGHIQNYTKKEYKQYHF